MIEMIFMIKKNHMNQNNHIPITVQTNEHGSRAVSRSTDVARRVSTPAHTTNANYHTK
jgi:hypothetical protein